MSAWKESQLAEVRLHARHTGEPLTRELIDRRFEFYSLGDDEIATAYAEGLAQREAGIRCLCPRCELDSKRITEHEQLRTAYARSRARELAQQGMPEDEIHAQIDKEIRAGVALRGATHS